MSYMIKTYMFIKLKIQGYLKPAQYFVYHFEIVSSDSILMKKTVQSNTFFQIEQIKTNLISSWLFNRKRSPAYISVTAAVVKKLLGELAGTDLLSRWNTT